MNSAILRCLLAAASVLATSASAQAPGTNAAAPTRLPDVLVLGDPGREQPSLTVPDATAARQRLQEIPGGVDLIPAEEFLKGRTATLKDVLEFSPGVFVQERFGSEEARLSIRGSGLQRTFHGRGITLLQDGVPLNLADGSFDMQAVEPLAAQYVEVFRGANALRYGSSTLGGAINFVSPTGYDADRIRLRFEAGSHGYRRGYASSGLVLGPADYFVSVSELALDGFQHHAEQHNQRLFSNVGIRLNKDWETRFYFTGVLSDSELPGSLTKAQLEANPRQANPANVAGDWERDFELYRVANKTTWRGDQQHFDLGAWWSHKDLWHPIPHIFDQNSNDLGVNAHYENSREVAGRPNRLTLGMRPTYGWMEDARFLNFGGHRGPRILSRTTESMNLEFYLEDELRVGERVALVGGLQYTLATRRTHRDQPAASTATESEDYHGLSPKLGLRYDLDEATQFFVNASRSFEPPSFGELSPFYFFVPPAAPDMNPLDAQSAVTVEVGSRGERGRFAWDVSLYHAWVDDELLTLNDAFGVPLGTLNASATRHMGVEAGFDIRLWQGLVTEAAGGRGADQLVLRQTYNWSRFVFDGDAVYGDNRLAGIPAHFYRAELVYEHPCGFYAGPGVEWSMEKYPIDHANSFFADPYALVNFKLGWRSQKGFAFFLEGRNLADKTYAATTGVIADAGGADSANFSPGVGRAFYGGIEWRW
jgi:iron complex outermembrane recepter protein